jgi:hypothetical protein
MRILPGLVMLDSGTMRSRPPRRISNRAQQDDWPERPFAPTITAAVRAFSLTPVSLSVTTGQGTDAPGSRTHVPGASRHPGRASRSPLRRDPRPASWPAATARAACMTDRNGSITTIREDPIGGMSGRFRCRMGASIDSGNAPVIARAPVFTVAFRARSHRAGGCRRRPRQGSPASGGPGCDRQHRGARPPGRSLGAGRNAAHQRCRL